MTPKAQHEQIQNCYLFSREDFVAHPVSTDVGNNRNDYPELLEPVEVVSVD